MKTMTKKEYKELEELKFIPRKAIEKAITELRVHNNDNYFITKVVLTDKVFEIVTHTKHPEVHKLMVPKRFNSP